MIDFDSIRIPFLRCRTSESIRSKIYKLYPHEEDSKILEMDESLKNQNVIDLRTSK